MWIGLISLFPEMFSAITSGGVLSRAIEQDILQLAYFNPRDFTSDRHRTVDDRPYGGGPGMLMMAQPLTDAIAAAKAGFASSPGGEAAVIYLSPQGRRLNQSGVRELAGRSGLILLCGRYEGVDERAIQTLVDEQVSIGDYVLTGGELPAMVLMDAVARHLPGTLGNAASAVEESHLDGLLDYPHYTRPEIVLDQQVPPILLSGDHGGISRWRLKESLKQTYLHRPDLLSCRPLSVLERELFEELFDAGLG